MYLLSLIHGYLDVAKEAIDMPEQREDSASEKIKAGATTVIPVKNILAVADAYEKEHPKQS